MTTGSRIRALRESRGMTQRQLAERAGCTDAAIRNYEAGRRALKGSVLDAIAGALGVAPEALMPVQAESDVQHGFQAVGRGDALDGVVEVCKIHPGGLKQHLAAGFGA